MNKIKLTQKELKEMFHYDEINGTFQIIKRYNKHLVGRIIKANKCKNSFYFQLDINNEKYTFHRLIALYMLGDKFNQDLLIDHIDGDTLNNSWSNLRVVTPTENNMNRKITSNSKTGVLGVLLRTRGKKTRYEVQINNNNKYEYLGTYEDFFEAVCVRKSKEIEYGYLQRS